MSLYNLRNSFTYCKFSALQFISHWVFILLLLSPYPISLPWAAGMFDGTAERVWVLDPVDGTKGFMRGEHYCIALALLVKGELFSKSHA